jgi:hypothetical protein
VAERLNAAVLKTAEPLRVPWVQIPPSPNPATGSRRFDLRAASSERAQGLQKLCSPFHFELFRLKAVVGSLRIAECRALVLQSLCENPTLSRFQKRSTDTSSQGSLWSMPRSFGDSIVWRQRWQWLSG